MPDVVSTKHKYMNYFCSRNPCSESDFYSNDSRSATGQVEGGAKNGTSSIVCQHKVQSFTSLHLPFDAQYPRKINSTIYLQCVDFSQLVKTWMASQPKKQLTFKIKDEPTCYLKGTSC